MTSTVDLTSTEVEEPTATEPDAEVTDELVEEVSIDGMCGVY